MLNSRGLSRIAVGSLFLLGSGALAQELLPNQGGSPALDQGQQDARNLLSEDAAMRYDLAKQKALIKDVTELHGMVVELAKVHPTVLGELFDQTKTTAERVVAAVNALYQVNQANTVDDLAAGLDAEAQAGVDAVVEGLVAGGIAGAINAVERNPELFASYGLNLEDLPKGPQERTEKKPFVGAILSRYLVYVEAPSAVGPGSAMFEIEGDIYSAAVGEDLVIGSRSLGVKAIEYVYDGVLKVVLEEVKADGNAIIELEWREDS